MKKIVFLSVCSIYIFFMLGLLFHTSAHPIIFGKYTKKYFLFLIFYILWLWPFLKIIQNLFTKSKLKLKNKVIVISSTHKMIFFLLIFLSIILSMEVYIRYIYRNFESNNYQYTIENFHPFLQSQLSIHENIHVNSSNFRNDEISVAKPEGTYRIVVLGGSTVLNREVAFEKNAVRLLEKRLRDAYPSKKIEVINAGKDSYTSEHSIIQYAFKIKKYNPDLVIMWQGINDLLMSCISKDFTKDSYQDDYSHSFGLLTNVIRNYFRPQPIVSIKLVSLDFLIKFIKDNAYSDTTTFINNAAKYRLAQMYKDNINTIYVDNFESITSYKRNLILLIQMLKMDNVFLILGNQPNLYKNKLTTEEVEKIMFPRLVCKKNDKYYSLSSFIYGMKLFNDATKEIALTYNIPFVDLDKKVAKNLNNFLDAVHYTEKGNEIIAQSLFEYIKNNNFLIQ